MAIAAAGFMQLLFGAAPFCRKEAFSLFLPWSRRADFAASCFGRICHVLSLCSLIRAKQRWWTLNSTLGYANKKALIFTQIAFISRPEIASFHVINKITLAKTYDVAFNFPKILAKTILTNQKGNSGKKEEISLLIA